MDEEFGTEQFDLDDILSEFHAQEEAEAAAPPGPASPDSRAEPREPEAAGTEPQEPVPPPETPALRREVPEPAPPAGEIPAAGSRDGTDPPTPVSEAQLRALVDADERERYGEGDEDAPEETGGAGERPEKERRMNPLLGLMAVLALRRQRRLAAQARRPTEEPTAGEDEIEPEEPSAKDATKHYNAQLRSLLLRSRLATGVCAVMLYLSLAYYSSVLPLTGALGEGVRALSLLLLILEITVVMIGLDVFTGGLLAIRRGRMGAETLVSVSCALSILDAALLALLNTQDYGLPFCTVSALSLCCALWGAYATCKGRRTGFRVLSSSKSLYNVTVERGLAEDAPAIRKTRQEPAGFIRRSEEADVGEYVYGLLTPFLLVAVGVLGVAAALLGGHAGAVLHCVSSLAAVSAAFSGVVCFSVPFAAAAQKLQQSGAAIAGWSGLREVGTGRYVVITDTDVFPRGTVELDKVRILEGFFADKVLSYTASLIEASGSALSIPFGELVRRTGYTIRKVDNFEADDGGGISGVVNGETVLVGGAGFMNLRGIRLPQKLSTRSTVFSAINGSLVGLFSVNYKPVSSVQDALVTLLDSRLEPLFAIRDFNITPALIKERFRLPTESFRFPPYVDRYRISGAEPDPDSRPAAVVVRDGMGPLVDVADRGRRTYSGVRLAAILSAVSAVLGVLMVFFLCLAGAFDSANVSNVLIYMLAWLIPVAMIALGVQR